MQDVTQSEIGTFNSCRYKWYLNYKLLWTPKKPIAPFEDGSAFHDALEAFGKGVPLVKIMADMRKGYEKIIKAVKIPVTQEMADDYQLRIMKLQGMVTGYVNRYKHLYHNDWEILDNEEEFAVLVESKRPKLSFIFRGKKDKRIRVRKTLKVKLVEHKSAAQIPASYINKLTMDRQTLTYTWADWKVYGKDCADSVVYDVVKKPGIRQTKKETRQDYFERLQVLYTEKADDHFFQETLVYSKKMLKKFERDTINIVAEMRHVAKSFKTRALRNYGACNEYGGCPYKDICTKRSLKGFHMNKFYKRPTKHQELNETKEKEHDNVS